MIRSLVTTACTVLSPDRIISDKGEGDVTKLPVIRSQMSNTGTIHELLWGEIPALHVKNQHVQLDKKMHEPSAGVNSWMVLVSEKGLVFKS